MSLSLPELTNRAKRWFPGRTRARHRIRVGLAPERIVLAAYARGWKSRLERAEATAVESRQGGARWQAAVDALPSVLAHPGAGKFRATVILSNQFARYAVLPGNAALKSEDEWLAYARHRLQAVHGNPVEGWDVRACETAPGGPRVVAAVDRPLLDALDAAVVAAGGVLESVQPYLMSAFNRARLPAGDGWLAIEEPGRLTLALVQAGAWKSIRSHRVDADWRRGLPELLAREGAALGLEQPCTDVYLQAETPFENDVHGDFSVHDLTPAASANERALAMVLA